ncbi:Suppressor of the cold-sensitive snRNP biogenesis mutant brr1-1, partial [Peltigera leucophlebia]|nr:Suppressor of the cold-sensitive snRNP biogenesis mutant brr1-1 [Peltigera leucophlebia]
MTLTVMNDSEVRSLLLALSREEVVRLQEELAESLHEYSTGAQATSACASKNQPKRSSIPAPDHQTTLFMPASTTTSRGMKIITLATPPAHSPSASATTLSSTSSGSPHPSSHRSQTPSSSHRSSSPSLQHSSAQSSSTPSVSSLKHSNSNSSQTPTRSQSPSLSSLKLNESSSIASSQSTTPRGSLTLFTPCGTPYAFLAAEELTAFRTALASTLIFNRRQHVHRITVFGAGKQAAWHIRLALLLRGSEIHHVDIVNRSSTRALQLLREIYTAPEWADLRTANEKLRFSVVSANHGEFDRMLKEHVRGSDAIFLCTPSLTPLFPAEFLTSPEGRRKGRYISAIGSYRPHMVEMHPDILRQAVAPEHKNHHHKHASKSGVIVVDSLEACLKESGEIRQAGLGAEQLVEVGELIMVKKAALKEIENGGEGEKGLKKWLEAGNVIYKSVGLGVMDISVGEGLVALA